MVWLANSVISMKHFNILIIAINFFAIGCYPDLPDSKSVAKPATTTTAHALVSSQPLAPTKAVYGTLSFKEQQRVWKDWLSATKLAVKAGQDPVAKQSLDYLEKNASLWDSAKGDPPRLDNGKYHIMVVNGDPSVASPWEQQECPAGIFAQYYDPTSCLIVTSAKLPMKVMGTIGSHESIHAPHWILNYKGRGLTRKELAEEEVSAYLPQMREFRALYKQTYEPLRQEMIKFIKDDIARRKAQATTPQEKTEASFPDLAIVISTYLNWPEKFEKAFSLAHNDNFSEIMVFMNFAILDASFAVLDQEYPDAQEREIMRPIMIDQFKVRAGI